MFECLTQASQALHFFNCPHMCDSEKNFYESWNEEFNFHLQLHSKLQNYLAMCYTISFMLALWSRGKVEREDRRPPSLSLGGATPRAAGCSSILMLWEEYFRVEHQRCFGKSSRWQATVDVVRSIISPHNLRFGAGYWYRWVRLVTEYRKPDSNKNFI